MSREVNGVGGERYRQNVSVFAGSAREAVALVASEFARLARITGKAEPPYRPMPEWSVEQVKLDTSKLITSSITS